MSKFTAAVIAANNARKALVAAFGAFGVWLGTAPTDGIRDGEWGALAGCFVTGIIAWLTPNDTDNVNVAERIGD